MIKKTFVITTNNVDSDGDILSPAIFHMPKSKTLPILDHFDASKKLGVVTDLKHNGTTCVMTGMFSEDPTGLYPAIGFTSIKHHDNAHGGKTYDEIKLWSVGITPAPNANPFIGPIQ